MTTFLFWNLKDTKLDEARRREDDERLGTMVARLAIRHEVDVLVLAGRRISPAMLLRGLNREEADYHFVAAKNAMFSLFVRFSGDYLVSFRDHPRMSV
jgi:hypothetical protein